MSKRDDSRAISRRRLIRRAGTVAAAVAGAGAASTLIAPAAQAADGEPLTIGQANTGTNTTTLTAGSASSPGVRLDNPTAGGSSLSIRPLATTIPDPNDPDTWTQQSPSTSSPVGSLYTDDWGDVSVVGQPGGGALGAKYVNLLYSPTWATMVVPISPIRYLDTRGDRSRVVPGSATFDANGRVMPKNSYQIPDLVLDMSALFLGGLGAVQANLSVLLPTAGGYGSLWDEGDFPVTASILFNPVMPELSNFTQTLIGSDNTIRLKTSVPAQYVLDIVGFVLTNPFEQLNTGQPIDGQGARGAAAKSLWHKRAPKG